MYSVHVARDSLDIFLLVLLRDELVFSTGHELVGFYLSQSLMVHTEVHLQTTLLNVVLPAWSRYREQQVHIWNAFIRMPNTTSHMPNL